MASRGHIVCIPLPAQGHLLPVLHFARKVALKGFTVTVINVPSLHDSIERTWKNVPGQDIRFEPIHTPLTLFDNDAHNACRKYVDDIKAMEDPLAELLMDINLRGPKILCVVSDYYHLSAPFSARKAGFPGVCWWPGLAAWASIEFHLPELIKSGDFPVKEPNKLISYPLPGLQPMEAAYLPFDFQESEIERVGMETFMFRRKRLDMESVVLVNSFYELEPETFEAMKTVRSGGHFLPIGPLFPFGNVNGTHVNLRTEDEECFAWLDRHPSKSVLYISFGSIATLTGKEFEALAEGLRASKQPFIWVIHADLLVDKSEEFYRDFLEGIKTQGLVISWAAQTRILEHDSTGGFLTHCGWNSVFEGICSAVPMLGWPCVYDQSTNSKLVLQGKGIGMCIRKFEDGNVFKHEVESKIQALMKGEEGKELRNNVEELQLMAESAAKEGGSSHKGLHTFLDAVQNQLI